MSTDDKQWQYLQWDPKWMTINYSQAPVPEKTISANRGLNPANRGIKFVLRLDCVPQNTIIAIPGI